MADTGFTCNDYARMAMAEVKTPPFTRGKKQLEKVDIDWSRELSTGLHLRIARGHIVPLLIFVCCVSLHNISCVIIYQFSYVNIIIPIH